MIINATLNVLIVTYSYSICYYTETIKIQRILWSLFQVKPVNNYIECADNESPSQKLLKQGGQTGCITLNLSLKRIVLLLQKGKLLLSTIQIPYILK